MDEESAAIEFPQPFRALIIPVRLATRSGSAERGAVGVFRLGALKPGDLVYVTLADHRVAVFKITAVRLYPKDQFPTSTVYGNTDYAALRLITCGGSFDEQGHHYRSNVVAFASLVSSHPAQAG